MANDKSQMTYGKSSPSLAEALSVFTRDEKRLDHFRPLEVAIKLVQLVEPELIATFIRVATEIAEVLHHDERRIALRAHETIVLGDLPARQLALTRPCLGHLPTRLARPG